MAMQIEPFIKVTFAFSYVIGITLFLYFAIAPGFTVFTNEYLTTADVPYYVTNPDWGWFNFLADPFFTDQFGMEWIWFLTDTWRFIFPVMWVFLMASALLITVDSLALVTGVTYGVLVFIEMIKTIVRIWQFGFCVNFQICRNWNPANCTQDSCPPNYAFQWIFWYQIGFLFIALLYTVLVLFVTKSSKVWHDKMEKWRREEIAKMTGTPK
jgi:hypothetical protein